MRVASQKKFLLSLIAVLGCYLVVFFVYAFPHAPFIFSDTNTYLFLNSYRTLGLPLLYRLVSVFSPTLYGVVLVQLACYVCSLSFLSYTSFRAFRSLTFSLVLTLLLFLNVSPLLYTQYLISDSLFFSAVCVFVGLMFLVFESPSTLRLVLLGLMVCLILAIRPIGIVFIGILPVLLVLNRRDWLRVSKALGGALVVGWVGLSTINYLVFGYFGVSRSAGYTMVFNAMLLMREDTPSRYPELARRLYQAGLPFQKELESQPTALEKHEYLLRTAAIMVKLGSTIVSEFAVETGQDNVAKARVGWAKPINDWFNDSSALNRSIARLYPSDRIFRTAQGEAIARQIAKEAYQHNLPKRAELQPRNVLFALRWLFFFPEFPGEIRGNLPTDTFYDPREGESTVEFSEVPTVTSWRGIDLALPLRVVPWMLSGLKAPTIKVWIRPVLAVGFAVMVVFFLVKLLFSQLSRPLEAPAKMLVASAAMIAGYVWSVCFAYIMTDPRYMMGVFPFTTVLLAMPVLLFQRRAFNE